MILGGVSLLLSRRNNSEYLGFCIAWGPHCYLVHESLKCPGAHPRTPRTPARQRRRAARQWNTGWRPGGLPPAPRSRGTSSRSCTPAREGGGPVQTSFETLGGGVTPPHSLVRCSSKYQKHFPTNFPALRSWRFASHRTPNPGLWPWTPTHSPFAFWVSFLVSFEPDCRKGVKTSTFLLDQKRPRPWSMQLLSVHPWDHMGHPQYQTLLKKNLKRTVVLRNILGWFLKPKTHGRCIREKFINNLSKNTGWDLQKCFKFGGAIWWENETSETKNEYVPNTILDSFQPASNWKQNCSFTFLLQKPKSENSILIYHPLSLDVVGTVDKVKCLRTFDLINFEHISCMLHVWISEKAVGFLK